MAGRFVGSTVYIYNDSETRIAESKVIAHNSDNSVIDIEYAPNVVDMGRYELLILTAPSPYAFSCVAETRGSKITLKLFRGEKKELRSNTRYKVNGIVNIIAYISDKKVFKLHSPMEAVLMNISKGGLRLKMKPNSLMMDDIFSTYVKIGESPKVLTAQVVNIKNCEGFSEYGCKLI